MSLEWWWNNYENEWVDENFESKESRDTSTDVKGKISKKAIDYFYKNKDNPDSIDILKDFLQEQDNERIKLDEKYKLSKKRLVFETSWDIENWDKTNQIQNLLYTGLWINHEISWNSELWKFEKWVVDWLVLDNIELVNELLEKWVEELLEILQQLASKEVILWILADLVDSIENIADVFSEPYEWWKALWWMWLWVIWKWLKWIKIADNINEKIELPSLYDIPKYIFLEKYKDILWEDISIKDVVWEWTQAIIMKHPINESLVIKIAKEWKVDDIVQEFNNHKLFFDTWRKWIKGWALEENIRIPKVILWEKNGYFIMEKIEWQSLYSKTLLKRFDKKLNDNDREILLTLEDKQVREFLKDKFWETDEYLDMLIEDYSAEHLADLLWTSHNYIRKNWKSWDTPLSNTLKYLEKQWISHRDLHPGNVMLDKNWKVYIIDFWRIRLIDNN